jgi:hypothetical protein
MKVKGEIQFLRESKKSAKFKFFQNKDTYLGIIVVI